MDALRYLKYASLAFVVFSLVKLFVFLGSLVG